MRCRRRSKAGEVSQDEINDHVHRILRTIFATGLFDHPVVKQVPDVERGYALAQSLAEKSIVLLKNNRNVLPLERCETAFRRADWRTCRRGRTHRRRLGAGRCTGRLRGSSATAAARRESHGELFQAPGLVAELAAARAHGQTAFQQSLLLSPAMTLPLPRPPPKEPTSQSSSRISQSRKAWT